MSSNHGGRIVEVHVARDALQVTLQLLGNSLSGAPTHINQMSFICGTNFKPTTDQLKTICLRDATPLTEDCRGAKFVNDLLVLFGNQRPAWS